MKGASWRLITCLFAIALLGTGFLAARYTLDTRPDELTNKLSSTTQVRSIVAGATGTITVHSPYSLDGAATLIWGFYKPTTGGWTQTIFGSSTITGGWGTINYAIPLDYASDFMWELDVDYSSTSNDSSCLTLDGGVWGQFENYDPNGTTITMHAYTFDQKSVFTTAISYRLSAVGGTVFPDPNVTGSQVDILRPWSGTIEDYGNTVYQSYPKTGLYPTYAINKGYSIEVLASNPSSPDFQEVRLYKDSIGYSVTLFGYKNTSGSDPLGYIWWTTLVPAATSLDMNYNGATGVFSQSFTTPLDLNTVYFLDPWVYEYLDTTWQEYYYISPGGGTDLLLSGAKVSAPINNTTQHLGYNSIQDAINAAHDYDTITISSGTYPVTTPIIVNKKLTISGPVHRDAPAILEGTDPNNVCILEITSSDVTIENFTITHSALPVFSQTPPWAELPNSLVRIPASQVPLLTNINFTNNTIFVPAQTGAMSTWNGVAFTVGTSSVNAITMTGNTIYNTRNGIVIQYNNYVTLTNNVIYNTKGGIMNYTGTQLDADHRVMTNNTWGTIHNEWDIVWNSGGGPYEPDYNQSVLVLSGLNNEAYVLSLMTATQNSTTLTGNRSHIFVNSTTGTTTPGWSKGNINQPYANLQLGIAAVVPGGKVLVAAGEFAETGQIVINKNINIIGADKVTTIIKPAQNTGASGDTRGWFLVQAGNQFNLSNVTLDGAGKLVNIGILSHGTGTINNNILKNIGYNPSTDYAGRGIAFYNANMTIINNTLSNIGRIGIYAYAVSNGIITGNTYTGKGVGNWLDYGIELEGGAVATISGNSITDCLGIASVDGSASGGILATTYFAPGTSAAITSNNFTDNTVAISLGYNDSDTTTATISGNTFGTNEIHVQHIGANPMNMAALLAPTNTYDNYFVLDQTIYGSTMLYVEAPEELIQDNEMQVYSVKAALIEGLRGYTVQIKIPKADFNAPVNFTIGSVFSGYPMGSYFLTTDVSDADYWIYNVSGTYLGGYSGIAGSGVTLFTFQATSLADRDNISVPGCWIELPLEEVLLKDDQNPYGEIECTSTSYEFILIDATEPTIIIDNLTTYPNGMTLPIDPVASALAGHAVVTIPLLSLDYWDNYDLDYSQFQIDGTAPINIAGFSGAAYLFNPGYVGATYDNLIWTDPNTQINSLADGTHTIYFLSVDDAGNFVIISWSFVIDKTATDPISWDTTIPCRTTPNANNSIDLKWANPVGAVKNHIWVLSYASLTGAGAYPEYNPAGFTFPGVPAAPNPYLASPQSGWTKYPVITAPAPTAFPYALPGMARGYYYITIFAEDASGNLSVAPAATFYRESISYWPGDVNPIDGLVQAADIGILSAAWGRSDGQPLFNNLVDVGPSTDYARRSRPTPDNRIDIEDLMMFAMNYDNTDYDYYPRNFPDANPITIAMNVSSPSDQLIVTLELDGNTGFVKGLDIPVRYGNGLQLLSVTNGEIWPEGSLMLNTNADGMVTVSGSTLGADPIVESNGNIVTLTFAIVGNNTDLDFGHMTARTWDNREIEIVNNPTGNVDNDDHVNVVPTANYLGKNYPNPFNPSTTIQYGLKQAGSVRISIFNSRGQLIRTLINDSKAAGTYQAVWNGLDNFNRPVSSGVYFFRMETNDGVKINKGLLVK